MSIMITFCGDRIFGIGGCLVHDIDRDYNNFISEMLVIPKTEVHPTKHSIQYDKDYNNFFKYFYSL